MITISRLKDRTFVVTEAESTEAAARKLAALGYEVTSTANTEYLEISMPSAVKAFRTGNFITVTI